MKTVLRKLVGGSSNTSTVGHGRKLTAFRTMAIALLCAGVMGLLTLSVVAAQTGTTPAAPTVGDIAATGAEGELTVSVTASSTGTTTGYEVRVCIPAEANCGDDGANFDPVAANDVVVNEDLDTITISSLMDGKEYAVQVRAVNSALTGDAMSSDWTTGVTSTGTPSTTPAAPTVGTIAPTGMMGELTVGVTASGTGTTTGYEVQTCIPAEANCGGENFAAASSTDADDPDSDDDLVRIITITGLMDDKEYAVRVRAVNNALSGDAANSDWVAAGGTPSTTPAAPTVGDIAPTGMMGELTVGVTASGTGTTTGYEVRVCIPAEASCGNDGTNFAAASSTDADDPDSDDDLVRIITITGLMDDKVYAVQVRAVNSGLSGDAANSDWTTGVTDTGTPVTGPGTPMLGAIGGTGTAGQLTVGVTASGTGTTTGYEVQTCIPAEANCGGENFAAASSTDADDPDSENDLVRIITITGLMDGKEYAVRVRAVNSALSGDAANSDWVAAGGTPSTTPAAPTVGDIAPTGMMGELTVGVTASGTGTTTGYEVRVCIPADVNCGNDGTNFAAASSTDADDPDSDDDLVRIITITGLMDDKVYAVQVRAVNSGLSGDAANSDWTTGVTDTGTPVTGPGTPMLGAIGGTGTAGQLTVGVTASGTGTTTGYEVQTCIPAEANCGGENFAAASSTDADDPDSENDLVRIITITGLMDGKEYAVRVRAVNSALSGDAANSDWVAAGGTPSTTPAAPTVGDIAPTGMMGELTVGVTASGTGTTTGYEVRVCIPADVNCGNDGTNFAAASSTDADDPDSENDLVRIITITGLMDDKEYAVQVRAVNSGLSGDAANSDWTAGVTDTGTPVTGPGTPTVDSIAGTGMMGELTVSVTASSTGTTTGYEVRVCIPAEANCGDDGANFAAASSTDADDPDSENDLVRIITITGLMDGKEYAVQVRAVNSELSGDAMSSAWFSWFPVPDMPTVQIAAGDGQLTVSWIPPAANYTGGINGYTVRWKMAGQDDYVQADAAAEATSYTIMGLTNDVTYTVQVLATNAKGNSPAAEVSGTPTAPPVVEVPVEVVVEVPVVETKTVDRVVYRTRSAPAPAPAPQPTIISDSGYATTYLAVDGQSIELRIHPHAGGPASHNFAVGSYVRDADLGQTYQIVAGGKRRWVSPDSPLVYAIPWPIVNSMYTFSSLVVAAIPLDESSPPDGFLVRGPNGRIVSYAMSAWRWVPSIPTFQALGYRWCDVNNADGGFFSRISEGSPHAASNQPEDPNYPVCG